MLLLFFIIITLVAALLAAFASNSRHAILALWCAGMGTGCVFLSLGAEMIAIIQWIVSTLSAISFVFFGIMFGEYSRRESLFSTLKNWRMAVPVGIGLVVVGLFAWRAWNLPLHEYTQAAENTDIVALGKEITDNHLLSLELLALTLFLTIVGCGVVARPEPSQEPNTVAQGEKSV